MDVVSSWTGARAHALRRALRTTNEAFAERLGAAVRTVGYWRERPDCEPQPVMQEALDTVLAQAPEPVRAQFWLILAEGEQDRASQRSMLAAASVGATDDELDRSSPHSESSLVFIDQTDPAAPFVHEAKLVTPGDLAIVRSVRAHLKAIDNANGGGTALPMATMYLRSEILPLLHQYERDARSQSLIEAVAEYELDIGWMAYDTGQQDVAERYFANALRRARAMGNRLLAGRILASMSHQAIHLGRLQDGIDFAQAARSVTAHIATPRALAMEAAMEACSYAAAGDARQSHRALDDAANAVTLITASRQSEPEWLDFDEGGFWGHAARTYRDLGELRDAEDAAHKSIVLCLPGHSRTRAQRLAICATAHLRNGELESAVDAGQQVVQEAWRLQSGHVFGEIARLALAISPFKTPVASAFLDQARELLTARRQLADGLQPGC